MLPPDDNNSLMDLLLASPSLAERFLSLQSMLPSTSTQGGGVRGTGATTEPSTGSTTEGGTAYPYTEYDKPYYGPPEGMMTRSGFSLQPGAMQSLIDIARQSDLMRGARELSMIGGGWRATNPTLATGQSYHQQGLAFDSSWWSSKPELRRLLEQYGWNWGQGFGDYPHWSYGVYG